MNKLIISLLLVFVCMTAWAQENILVDEKTIDQTFTVQKPLISSTKILNVEESEEVKTALTQEGRILIHPRLDPVKNDYIDDYDRGTVKYTQNVKNYSFHKVIIPDGTTVEGVNFTQNEPNTDAIVGENLTFIDCNLVNVRKHDSWKLLSSNNSQTEKTLKELKNEENSVDLIK